MTQYGEPLMNLPSMHLKKKLLKKVVAFRNFKQLSVSVDNLLSLLTDPARSAIKRSM